MKKKKTYGKKGPNQIFNYSPVEDTTLLTFLFEVLAPKSRSDVKSMLAHHHVQLNGNVMTQFDTPVKTSDVVSVNFTRPFPVLKDHRVHILYEDDWLLAIEKASGLLSVGREGGEDTTAWSLVTDYIKQKDPRLQAFVCHRLDQYTSGILIFAKDGAVQRELRYQWDRYVRERAYMAVVEGRPENDHAELRDYLYEDSKMNVHIARDPEQKNARLAVTRYSVVQTNGRYSLLDVQIFTGRKNQIRVQLSESGYPVAGDRKYGAQTNPGARLMLHNNRLSLEHPVTHEILTFNLPAPKTFYSLTRSSAAADKDAES